MTQRTERIPALLLLVSFVEGIVVGIILLSIPADPKNAFLFGYSKSRLVLFAVVVALLILLGTALLNRKMRALVEGVIALQSPLTRSLPWLGGVSMLLLWLTIWIPAYRFEEGAAGFTRLQPLVIWIELLVVQAALAAWAMDGAENFHAAMQEVGRSRKWLRVGIGLFILTLIIFTVLLPAGNGFTGKQLYFPPGVPLSALQVILTWGVFFLLLRLEQKSRGGKANRKWVTVLLFILVWAATFAAWSSIPIPCTDDRPGPFPPNNICYPNINDAVYSIGSHYITLGRGVYNHWLTDKPLYMAFLALGQTLTSPNIDDYLGFQVAVIALLPALLFLVGKKKVGYAFGVWFALLAALQGAYAISLYREVGSVNVKLENPEVLTALFLILFSISAFKWISAPAEKRWAILSGGLLGLTVLLRFTPLFIVPFLFIVVFIVGKGSSKKILTASLFFGLAFLLAFGPWFIAATSPEGRNHYITKIEEVISSRFSSGQEQQEQGTPTGTTAGNLTEPTFPLPQTRSDQASPEGGDLLSYELGAIDKAGISGVLYHFLNNLFTGLAKLPTDLVLHPIQEQVSEGIWTFTQAQPIWKTSLRAENLLAMGISLALVLIGILTAFKRFGFAGLTGVVIQLGYYAGNAVSQTSGGRYLEPVFWVLLLYYCLGIYTLTVLGIKAFSRETIETSKEFEQHAHTAASMPGSYKRWVNPVLLLAFLGCGLILPALNLIPEKLPEETDPAVAETAYERLSQRRLVTTDEWTTFLEDPDRVLIQGRAYHPRYYRGNFYRPGNLSFEVMLLVKDHVLVGYSPRMIPREPFSDGSDVILIGCRIREDALWAARRVIVESIAVIQLNNEGNLLFDENAGWGCGR